jgi:hypothetical protein
MEESIHDIKSGASASFRRKDVRCGGETERDRVPCPRSVAPDVRACFVLSFALATGRFERTGGAAASSDNKEGEFDGNTGADL